MPNTNLTLVYTADGSKSIYNAEVGEQYHSRHGALQESQHVFLKSGFKFFLEKNDTDSADILEVGFGTGLNFLLTADYCLLNKINIHYTGIEAYPLSLDMIYSMGYGKYLSPVTWQSFLEIYSDAFNHPAQVNSFCELSVAERKLFEFKTERRYDVVYFDAFAAVHQPEMWTEEALSHICSFIKPGGVFVTYAITGNLKRSIKALGFSIEKAPGAPGKREMLRAIKF